jgi:hypothetical protein
VNGALTIHRFGDRWEIGREDEGINRRIGILHHRDDADLFVAAGDLLKQAKFARALVSNLREPEVNAGAALLDLWGRLDDVIQRAEGRR